MNKDKKLYIYIHTYIHTYITHIYFVYLGASLVAQMVKNLPAVQETLVPSLGWKDSLVNCYPLQYSCLENSMDRGAQQAPLHTHTVEYYLPIKRMKSCYL